MEKEIENQIQDVLMEVECVLDVYLQKSQVNLEQIAPFFNENAMSVITPLVKSYIGKSRILSSKFEEELIEALTGIIIVELAGYMKKPMWLNDNVRHQISNLTEWVLE